MKNKDLLNIRQMRKRLQRQHWSGSSNRIRSRKIIDTATVLETDPQETLKAENRLAASMSQSGLTRSVVVFNPPQLVKTKLGGVYYATAKKCAAEPYQEIIEDSYMQLHKNGLVQGPWSDGQPPLGIPVWSNDPPQSSPFSTCGKSAPHVGETESSAPAAAPFTCGIPTRGIMQYTS